MKKIITLSLIVIFILSFVVFNCFAQETKLDQAKLLIPTEKTLKFVFIAKLVHPWYEVVDEGIQAAVEMYKKLGINIEYKWDSPVTADITKHIHKIESNISARPDGIAVACLNPEADTEVLNSAVDAGLNVITFDTDAPESKRAIYVGHSKFERDGIILADALADLIDEKGKIGILTGSPGAPNHEAWVAGFKKGIANYKNIEIVFERPDHDQLETAVDLTETALQAHPDIAGFFCCNASNPIGAARAVENAGKGGEVKIVGMCLMPETVEFMQKGVIQAAVEQRQWEEGWWSVVYLVAMNQNHTIPVEHQTGAKLFYKEDLDELLGSK